MHLENVSCRFFSPVELRAKTDCWSPVEGLIFRHRSLVVNTAGTLCEVNYKSLVVMCTLPSVCHAPVWVLDIVAVTVVSTVLAGLARKVHLDGADVNSILNFI